MAAADFIAFTDRLDRCWMEGDLPELGSFLAPDVVFVAPGGMPRAEGLEAATESYRQFLSHAQVKDFHTGDHFVTARGDTAVVEYRWQMAWTAGGADRAESGRDILVLARREEGWRVVWRTQIPGGAMPA